MFGERLDYQLLRPLTHTRNRADEHTLNAQFAVAIPPDVDAAAARLAKLRARFEGHFELHPGLRWLDVGCGRGDLDLALLKAGATDVTGIDLIPRNIEAARNAIPLAPSGTRLHFECGDIHRWKVDEPFDVVMSHEALEHIHDPGPFLTRLRDLARPGGIVYLAFGPLFHSPTGDHLDDFFRIFLPWRGVLFNERALMRLRADQFRPGDAVERFEDMAGGMNKMRFSEFRRYVNDAGFQVEYLGVNPQLKRVAPLKRLSDRLVDAPFISDYLASSIYIRLRTPT